MPSSHSDVNFDAAVTFFSLFADLYIGFHFFYQNVEHQAVYV